MLASELVTIINGTAAITSIQGAADLDPAGNLRICNDVPDPTSTILVAAGALATAVGFDPIGSAVSATDHAGGTIPAGTRLRASGTPGAEWVVMQTQDIPAGEVGPVVAKVRPGLDDGTHAGASAGAVDTIVDAPTFAALTVNNPAALTAALTEAQLDNAYLEAMTATLDESGVAREANYLLSARRSDSVVRDGRANVIKATECGLFARIFITGDPIGTTATQIIANVASFRRDRVFYTGKALKVRIPEIAAVGTAGGVGFTADGIISVRPDGPLTTICATLPPENNPGEVLTRIRLPQRRGKRWANS